MPDAIVVGAGPNGLSAAVALARAGLSVQVLEAAPTVGGGTRSAELTRPGFLHDVCSAVHPTGFLSPYWTTLPLAEHGLTWLHPPLSVAHPLDGGRAAVLHEDLETTCGSLGADGRAWRRLLSPLLAGDTSALLQDILGPLGIPRRPFTLARFGLTALQSARFAARRFGTEEGRALWAGLAAHSILPLTAPLSAAIALAFAITAHRARWPVAAGGSQAIADALTSLLKAHGGEVRTGVRVRSLDDLPEHRVVLFDTSPAVLDAVCGDALPLRYRRRLRRFVYGPGVFKLDWALDGPIPWANAACADASTVHVGGTLEEIAAAEQAPWDGKHSDAPYLIVCQQSHFDPSRAPAGQHTGYAYCHVPAGSTLDRTAVVEAQIERFAPGFGDRILQRHAWTTADFDAHNPALVGGAITGGAALWHQLFTRPVARWDPYSTPHPRIFLCSASTPPGGGVHGMCGFHAARSALRSLGLPAPSLG